MSAGKLFRRIGFIGNYSLLQFLPALFNLAVSLIIVRHKGAETWGEIVLLQLLSHFALAFIGYGNKEFLLKAFAEKPSAISSYFMLSLSTRSILILPLFLLIFFFLPFDAYIRANLLVWILARYISSSFDAYVIHKRAFAKAIWAEVIPSLMLILLLLFQPQISFEYILFYMSSAYLFKAFISLLFFRDLFRNAQFTFNLEYLRLSYPFAALSITGLLQSRADLLLLGILMPPGDLAQYQVLTSFLVLMQAIPSLIVSPFASQLYRGNSELEKKIKRQVILAGLMVSAAGIAAIYLLLPWLYAFTLPPLLYLLSFLYTFSTFLFYIDIYRYYRMGKAKVVLIISLCSAVSNIAACYILIPLSGMQGAMSANLFSQLILWLFFSLTIRRGDRSTTNPTDN